MEGSLLLRSISLLKGGLGVIFDLYFLWLPFFLWAIFWAYWKRYVIAEALLNEEYSLIQIKLPRDITKSPKAMELFLQNLHQTGGEGSLYDKYWKGGTRPWFSLELVSINGEVRFYIWTRKKFAKLIEISLYSQYPNLEIIVGAEDYTKKFKYDPDQNEVSGTMFALTKDDPYPIKTYVDYGLDKDPKEEFKIDPIASVIEFLGSVGVGEQVWIQIIVRAHKKYEKKSIIEKIKKSTEETLASISYKDWEKRGKETIEKLKLEDLPADEAEIEKSGKVRLTKFKESIIEAIERSVVKPGFDAAIRGLYLAEKDKFDAANVAGLTGSFKQYNSDGLNGFKPKGASGSKMFNRYIRREHFETRHNVGDFILNTEELATIFHFPSASVETPNLPRVLSKKAEPPTNLPL